MQKPLFSELIICGGCFSGSGNVPGNVATTYFQPMVGVVYNPIHIQLLQSISALLYSALSGLGLL
jgi:hypothetical protein